MLISVCYRFGCLMRRYGVLFVVNISFVLQKDLTRNRTQFELTISEGKNHQVKNMMLALGHEVRRLHRVKFAFLDVKDLRAGEYRRLKPYEIKQLNRLSMEGEQK